MSGGEWEDLLWWVMLLSGVAAASLSLGTNALDRRKAAWPTPRQRFLLHIVSYGFVSVSVLAFVMRGLLSPT